MVKRRAFQEGFDAVGITAAELDPLVAQRLRHFIDCSYHGDMGWLAGTAERRGSPRAMWPQAKSAIMLALCYGPPDDPLSRLADRRTGVISVYALGRDYHEVIKGKLKRLAQWLARTAKAEVKVFVDTAPLMEKPLEFELLLTTVKRLAEQPRSERCRRLTDPTFRTEILTR